MRVESGGDLARPLTPTHAGFPGTLEVADHARWRCFGCCRQNAVQRHRSFELASVKLLPPLANPEKVICVGLNYRDHSAESGFKQPDFPTLFGRFNSSLIGHGAPILRPPQSEQLDYEGELVAVIGKTARDVS